MPNIEHGNITDPNIHVCKGMTSASAGALVVGDGAGGQAVTTSGTNVPIDINDNEVAKPHLKDISEEVQVVAASSTAVSLDMEDGNIAHVTLTDNCTITITNPPVSGRHGVMTIYFEQDGSGGHSVTGWPSGTVWAGAAAPSISSGASEVDVITLSTFDGGATWYGFIAGQDMS